MEKMKLPVTKKQMDFLKTLGIEDRLYTPEEMEYIADEDLIDALNEPIRRRRALKRASDNEIDI